MVWTIPASLSSVDEESNPETPKRATS